VVTRSTITIAFAAVARTARGAIDFTPATGERTLEGIRFPELYFHENGRKISYEQPRGWTYTGDATSIKFIPSDVRGAFADITQAPLQKPQNFDDDAMKSLQAKALTLLSPDAGDIVVVSAEKNPLMINAHETFEVILAFQLYGEHYRQSVLFLNLPDTQLSFRVLSRKVDFERLHRDFRGSLCSLQWL
jgi:hypothetical protein